ncbi:MAG: transporter [Anaeromicrobium sp.]|jgi:Na+/H+ antiporter NhaC|uniref:Na+/H+ antiporter NhaC family protein n=1 Tax=Anaeromicrobium sp. TaxID=1929132 RepID=UPI0025F50D08|nr:Na+/H+ antiporter NhaC family protein [Anaeromicrobium sp.]MCT4592930.1 transporter [Anaeromicrobium sp.]
MSVKSNNKNNIILIVATLILGLAYISGLSFKGIEDPSFGFWSIVPALTAVTLAFITREALFSLLIASIVGVFIQGKALWSLSGLFTRSLGNGDFIWVVLIEVFIGVLVAFFLKTGSTDEFSRVVGDKINSRKGVQILAWFLGMFIFFSDYFSPLFVGPVMKNLTDKARISREKLAYICDSTSAPMAVIIPFSAWGVFITGLLVGHGPIKDTVQAAGIYFKSVGFNLYAIFAVAMVGLIALGIIPEFGPMKKAELRALNEGKVLSDTAQPLMGVELAEIKTAKEIKKPRLFLNFILPVLIIICIAVGTYIFMGSAKTVEAFMSAVFFLGIMLIFQKLSIKDIFETAIQGIKGVMPAILILAMAYVINTVSKDLGAAQYIISITEGWLTPSLLPVLTFFVCAFISFSTGTSWGTYAIMVPIAVPLAFAFTGNEVTTLVYATIGAVAGGGVFGDHCSPLSDTTILSSFGAASDHIDHVKTQLPYASVAAVAALVVYFVIGII